MSSSIRRAQVLLERDLANDVVDSVVHELAQLAVAMLLKLDRGLIRVRVLLPSRFGVPALKSHDAVAQDVVHSAPVGGVFETVLVRRNRYKLAARKTRDVTGRLLLSQPAEEEA